MTAPYFRERITRKSEGKVVAYIDVDETARTVVLSVGINGIESQRVELSKREWLEAVAHVADRERHRLDRRSEGRPRNRCVGSFQGKGV